MKNLYFLILGVVMMIAISATTVSVMTVKPATPKNVLVKVLNLSFDVDDYVLDGYRRGYILKEIYINSQSTRYIVVMERY